MSLLSVLGTAVQCESRNWQSYQRGERCNKKTLVECTDCGHKVCHTHRGNHGPKCPTNPNTTLTACVTNQYGEAFK